jgi:hypothetical protein
MRLPSTFHRWVVAGVVATGLGLFGSALQGVARMDTSLEVAATRAAPDRALVQETRYDGDCPYRAHSDDV